MKAREDAGYVVTKVEEDPAILYEQHRKASCMRARHILERYDSPDPAAVGILHGIVGEVNAHDPEDYLAAYLTYPSDKAVQLAGDGLTAADIAEKRKMGGWNPQTDPLMLINEQGDWTGVTQQQADQIVWDNREEILERARAGPCPGPRPAGTGTPGARTGATRAQAPRTGTVVPHPPQGAARGFARRPSPYANDRRNA